MLRNVTETISITDLHDLTTDEYEDIIVTVTRRNEPGAGDFRGIVFISEHSNVARFKTPDEALTFIDDLQQDGLLKAISNQLPAETPSNDEIVSKLHGPTEEINTEEYIKNAGIRNPLNLTIKPKIKTTEKINQQNTTQQETTTGKPNSEHA